MKILASTKSTELLLCGWICKEAADDEGDGTTLEEGLEKPVGYIQGTAMH